jgi:hypothetical protein
MRLTPLANCTLTAFSRVATGFPTVSAPLSEMVKIFAGFLNPELTILNSTLASLTLYTPSIRS